MTTLDRDTATNTIRLAIVDDHAILRQGLRSVLERQHDLTVVGEAATESEAEAMVREAQPDVVLLDLEVVGRIGLRGTVACAPSYPARIPESDCWC